MLPTDFSLFISFTTWLHCRSAYSHFHDNISNRCLPQPAKHYIQYNLLACHIIVVLASLPTSCFDLSGDWNLLRSLTSKFWYCEQVVAIVGDHPYIEVLVGVSKVRQHIQPLSCSRHKRNGCRAQAQAALPTMMSGFHGCLRTAVTWVASGEKEGESFHVCFSAAQCWRGTGAKQGLAWSAGKYNIQQRRNQN